MRMGLFKELALLPLAPVRGTTWVAQQLAEEADRQLYDQDRIKRELVQLELDEEEDASASGKGATRRVSCSSGSRLHASAPAERQSNWMRPWRLPRLRTAR